MGTEAIEKRIAEIKAELEALEADRKEKEIACADAKRAYDDAFRARSEANTRCSAKAEELKRERMKIEPDGYADRLRDEYRHAEEMLAAVEEDTVMNGWVKKERRGAWEHVISSIEWQADMMDIEL